MKTIKIISMCLSGLLGLSPALRAAGTADNVPDASVKAVPGQSASADYVETAFGMQFEMVYVAGGTFQMGGNGYGTPRYDNEFPVHSVTLDDYYIGKFEVTQAQWQAVMGTNPSCFQDRDDFPVERVSWDDAVQFCEKLSALTGKTYRLPTEAEWEYAARGGQNADGTKYAGSNNIDDVAWYDGNSGRRTHVVGQKRPNGLGLYDMSGNVWEWCSDWYDENYYGSSPERNPTGPASGSYRVYRGGSWFGYAANSQVAFRYRYDFPGTPSAGYNTHGFRLVCEPEAEENPSTAEVVAALERSMVYVAGGTFEVGCTAEQGGDCHDDETPVHSVTLSDYYIGKFEVTQAQWKAVMGTTIEDMIGENDELRGYGLGDDYPMYYVCWDDAVQFCEKLSVLTGKTYRLPTGAEWEYAAWGGQHADGTKYAGSDNIDEVAWYSGNSGSKTHPVGTKSPNGLGLYDMSGNVWEWCSDWYDSLRPYRVFCGGHWNSDTASCRIAYRGREYPDFRFNGLGFRVVCEPASGGQPSAAARIRAISCPDADVTRLDLSRCPALADLTCSGNALTALDVSASPALTDLDCSGNRIATLRTAATFGSQGAGAVRLFDNCLPLSALAEIDGRLDAAGQSGAPVARYTPQRIPVELTLGKALDLNAELKLNGVETTVDFGTAAASDYVFKNGQLRFKRVGTYAVRLRNGSVRDRGDDAVVEVFYDITVKAGGGSDDPGDNPDEPLTPPTDPDEPGVANEDLASASSVWAYVSGRTIYVTDAVDVNSDEVSVYTTVGQRIYWGHGRAIEVPQAGVYVLMAGERRLKVLVR